MIRKGIERIIPVYIEKEKKINYIAYGRLYKYKPQINKC